MSAPGPDWRLSARLGWRLAAVMLVAIALAAGSVGWRTLGVIRTLDDALPNAEHGAESKLHEQLESLVAALSAMFLHTALWLLLPLMLVTVAIGVVTIRSGLRPLRMASAAARRVGPGAPGVRLPAAGLPRELAPLVGAVNAALERLERALEAQRRFAGDAAHALRTPLAVLAARIELLGDRPGLAALREDADRLTRLVGQMLALSRLEGLPLDVSGRFDFREVVAGVVAALAPLAATHGVDLALAGVDGAMPARGDAAAVELALQNLLHNAIQHAPAGSEVEVELALPATARVLDRGPGVPEAARKTIFERFHTERPGGAGLGLAIVAGVAASHGGSAWVEPRAGGGAVFVLRLPG